MASVFNSSTIVSVDEAKLGLGPGYTALPDDSTVLARLQDEQIPFDIPFDDEIWGEWKNCRTWPKRNHEFAAWFDRLEGKYSEVWEAAGIYDCLRLCKHDLPIEKEQAISQFWCTSSNSFHFPCGPMAPTVFYVSAITGLLPWGKSINPGITLSKDQNKHLKDLFAGVSQTHSGWITALKTDQSEREHIGFLLYRLSKCIFCPKSVTVQKEYAPIAFLLSKKEPLALAPPVVAEIDASLGFLARASITNTKTKIINTIPGPLWILPFWTYEYFPAFAPPSKEPSFPCYGKRWVTNDDDEEEEEDEKKKEEKKAYDFEAWNELFHGINADIPLFPFQKKRPSWFAEGSPSQAESRYYRDSWASFLVSRDLLVGMSK